MIVGPEDDATESIDLEKGIKQIKKYFNKHFFLIIFILVLVVIILLTKYAYWKGEYTQCKKLDGIPMINTRTGEKICQINKENFGDFGNTIDGYSYSSWD